MRTQRDRLTEYLPDLHINASVVVVLLLLYFGSNAV